MNENSVCSTRLLSDSPAQTDAFGSHERVAEAIVQLIREDSGGNWYECPQLQMEGWLCPAMFKYFRDAPKTIYFKAEKK